MASPKNEQGHLRIPNELVEILAQIPLTGSEWRLIWAVLRKTLGWNKKEDWIALSRLEELTGLSNRAVCRAQQSLLAKKILLKERNKLSFNTNYNSWLLSKMTLSKLPLSGMSSGTVKNDSVTTVKNDSHNKQLKNNIQKKDYQNDKDARIQEMRKAREYLIKKKSFNIKKPL